MVFAYGFMAGLALRYVLDLFTPRFKEDMLGQETVYRKGHDDEYSEGYADGYNAR